MNQYVKRTQRDYPLSFKLAVVEQVEKGEIDLPTGARPLRYSRPFYRPEVATQVRSTRLAFSLSCKNVRS
ncbi:hypothetical protein [Yersinia enterocolitica]|uniref:hypothetical protein n=1 Tax=Yersinia enterocolitica TaxID=630 RepID=UPI0011D26B5F|nr:hypothetical protein [Yersinia enterocolitica]